MSAAKDTPARGKGKRQPTAKDRAKAITEALDGEWNEIDGKGRYARCLVCEAPEMSVTPTPKAILVHCHRCGKAGQRRLFALARKGFDLRGDPPPRKHRRKGLPVADSDALIGLTPPQRRALLALAKHAKGGQWLEARQRWLVETCRVSGRDAIPLVTDLVGAGFVYVQGNSRKPYQTTTMRFLVDPADLERRLEKAWGSPKYFTEKTARMVSCDTKLVSSGGRGGLRTYAGGLDSDFSDQSTSSYRSREDETPKKEEGETLTRWKPPCGGYECHDDCVTRRGDWCERTGVRLLDWK